MPVHKGKDKKGYYYQWGESGKKYYYKKGNKISEGIAKSNAAEQGRAIKASQCKSKQSGKGYNNFYYKYLKYKKKYQMLKNAMEFDIEQPAEENEDIKQNNENDQNDLPKENYDVYGEKQNESIYDMKDIQEDRRLLSSKGNEEFYIIVKLDKINDKYIVRDLKPNIFNVLKISTVEAFDKFTDRYGYVDGNAIKLRWERIANDFKGLYLDHDTDLRLERFDKAVYRGKEYESWWEDKWLIDDVIIFER